MSKSRFALLVTSGAVVLVLLTSGWVARVGASDGTHNQVIVFSDVLSLVSENYVDPVDAGDLLAGAYEGMTGSLDARGAFLTPEEVASWNSGEDWRAAGPGVSVLKGYGIVQVVLVQDGSPADASGVRAGDQIRRIDGVELRDVSLDQVRRLLGGQAGTRVELEIVRPDDGFSHQELQLERSVRKDRPYEVEVRQGVGVVHVVDLQRIAVESLRSDLDDLRSGGVERVLIDVRNVAEGSPRDAARVASLFPTDGGFSLRDRSGEMLETVEIETGGDRWEGETFLLVNGASAGASEALALLLQKNAGVRILGEATFGLGSEPRLFELADGSGVLLSTTEWSLPTGETWTGAGVEPDLVIRPTGSTLDERFENQLSEALEAMAEGADSEGQGPSEA